MKKKIISITFVALIVIFSWARVLMTKTKPITDGRLNWIIEKKIAHRGIHNNKDIPENSLKAFEEAIKEGYTIELDVQLSKDKIIMVYHDYNLKRVTGLDEELANVRYEDLKKISLFNTEEKIPTLQEVFKLVDGKTPLLIEIKNEGKVGDLEELLYKELKEYKGEYAIQAFNPFVLEWFKNNANEIPRGQLAGGYEDSNLKFYEKFILRNLLLNFKSRPAFIAYKEEELPKGIVTSLKKSGTPILGWVITKNSDLDKVYENCDNIIFE
ncbi:glycerophosphodiester phosphodiesterase family protein [Clostridium sp.]|uniref:glycerophosphodiester phosphodiesterase family protein n=1 Tax=Clostridium sp. TaxID=1506 RepID=UPI002625B927|nr:glycerophosphodiester phosphodiesterase family protein [Clostridium sp.]